MPDYFHPLARSEPTATRLQFQAVSSKVQDRPTNVPSIAPPPDPSSMYRIDDNALDCLSGAVLPDRCIVTNEISAQQDDLISETRTLYFTPAWIYLFHLLTAPVFYYAYRRYRVPCTVTYTISASQKRRNIFMPSLSLAMLTLGLPTLILTAISLLAPFLGPSPGLICGTIIGTFLSGYLALKLAREGAVIRIAGRNGEWFRIVGFSSHWLASLRQDYRTGAPGSRTVSPSGDPDRLIELPA